MNPLHLMTAIDQKLPGDYPDGFRYADDVMVIPLQCATQWDSLAHVHYDGQLYNGFPAATTSSAGAARKCGIDKVGAGVVSRGVLLDIARLKGVARVAPGTAITPADLEAAEKAQGVRVESGDVLLVRTGHLSVFTVDGDRDRLHAHDARPRHGLRRLAARPRGRRRRLRHQRGRGDSLRGSEDPAAPAPALPCATWA